MKVRASAVVRVIIGGEWIWVEPGTFTVVDYSFTDDDGKVINRSREPAYSFTSTNGDPYFGPLSAIQLIKLRAASLDVSRDGEQEGLAANELPAAGESGASPDAEGDRAEAMPEESGGGAGDEAGDEADPKKKKASYSADDLFSDPVPQRVAGDHGGGLL